MGGDKIIRFDEAQLREHLDRRITQCVEAALTGMLHQRIVRCRSS